MEVAASLECQKTIRQFWIQTNPVKPNVMTRTSQPAELRVPARILPQNAPRNVAESPTKTQGSTTPETRDGRLFESNSWAKFLKS